MKIDLINKCNDLPVQTKKDNVVYPVRCSQIYDCKKRTWLLMHKILAKPTIDLRLHLLFETGNIIESVTSQLLDDRKTLFGIKEIKSVYLANTEEEREQIENDLTFYLNNDKLSYMRGRLDGIITDLNNERYVFECKSMNETKFKSFYNIGAFGKCKKDEFSHGTFNETLKAIYPVYYNQAQLYMHLSDIKQTVYVFVNKNTSEIGCGLLEYNSEYTEYLLKHIDDIAKSNDAPQTIDIFNQEITPNKTTKACEYCDYLDLCTNSNYDFNVELIEEECLSCKKHIYSEKHKGYICFDGNEIDYFNVKCSKHKFLLE